MAFFGSQILPIPDPINDVFTGLNRLGRRSTTSFGVDGQRPRRVLPRHLTAAATRCPSASCRVVHRASSSAAILGLVAGYFKGADRQRARRRSPTSSSPSLRWSSPSSIVTFLGPHALLRHASRSRSCRSRCWPGSRARRRSSWSEREFVLAARAQGAKHGRVMIREVSRTSCRRCSRSRCSASRS